MAYLLLIGIILGAREFDEIKQKAEQGDADAQFKLAEYYYSGKGVKKDIELAKHWCFKAAEQDHTLAQAIIGACYFSGKIVKEDFKSAVFWLHKAAEKENAYAQYFLGMCYFHGKGVNKDFKLAVFWLRKAAEKGNAYAQFSLAICYFYGDGVEKNTKTTVFWLRKAVEQKEIHAQHFLSVCYFLGTGVDKDPKLAVFWARKAAEQGYTESQYNLGLCYLNGIGVSKDLKQAVFWIEKAAAHGHAGAQMQLNSKPLKPIYDKQNRSWIENEGLAWGRLLTSPIDIFSPVLMTYHHIYTDTGWSRVESVLVSPFIPIVSLLPGIFMFIGDIFVSLGEMMAGDTLATSNFPWECFDYEITEKWNSGFWKMMAFAGMEALKYRSNHSWDDSSSFCNPVNMNATNTNPYGPHINQYGQPVQYTPAFGGVQGEQLQIKKNVYGPGVHQDQYGRPVYERPVF